MSKETFIRLDTKGHWRGNEHRSSVGGLGDEYEDCWEDGISCYSLDGANGVAYALDSLRQYWTDVAMLQPSDYNKMQITVFEGFQVTGSAGYDEEDLATCERTLIEIDASTIMLEILDLRDQNDEGEIDEDEYEDALKSLYDTKIRPLVLEGMR